MDRSNGAATYSEEQLARYLDHVGYPRREHAPSPLDTLAELVARQICRAPFESLALHYSQHHTLSLDLDALYHKIVVEGRGGYCMELNAFFAAVLRGLGFAVLTVAGRVMGPDGRYTGWSHMVNLVTVDGTRYAVDVGFGSLEPMCPVPLTPGFEFTQIAPCRGRLEHRALAQHTDPSQRLWVYSTQDDAAAPWVERNCFADVEFFPADYAPINYHLMTHPTSYFVQTVLAMRGVWDPEARRVGGVVTLHKAEVKRRMAGGEQELLETLRTEEERVRALEKYFDVVLTPLEQRGISGMTSELRG
ncbi:Arylamine N-acetyltransferase 2 [Tolypocladium paradoxum]|uniref:Arylamine N-acetyltransferase 2 n=1 Tax=Tolypocladium paradoxum TaxID=94208 RepID=A0A2S4L9X0_9HYPO|nr:Arylamine N-acetyltransferase 2 [Tolypocladium paradoxum]